MSDRKERFSFVTKDYVTTLKLFSVEGRLC